MQAIYDCQDPIPSMPAGLTTLSSGSTLAWNNWQEVGRAGNNGSLVLLHHRRLAAGGRSRTLAGQASIQLNERLSEIHPRFDLGQFKSAETSELVRKVCRYFEAVPSHFCSSSNLDARFART